VLFGCFQSESARLHCQRSSVRRGHNAQEATAYSSHHYSIHTEGRDTTSGSLRYRKRVASHLGYCCLRQRSRRNGHGSEIKSQWERSTDEGDKIQTNLIRKVNRHRAIATARGTSVTFCCFGLDPVRSTPFRSLAAPTSGHAIMAFTWNSDGRKAAAYLCNNTASRRLPYEDTAVCTATKQ